MWSTLEVLKERRAQKVMYTRQCSIQECSRMNTWRIQVELRKTGRFKIRYSRCPSSRASLNIKKNLGYNPSSIFARTRLVETRALHDWTCLTPAKNGYSLIFKAARVAKIIWRLINTIVGFSFGAKICSDICPCRLSVTLAHSLPRASLSENFSLFRTDNVRGKISEHVLGATVSTFLYLRCEQISVWANSNPNIF